VSSAFPCAFSFDRTWQATSFYIFPLDFLSLPGVILSDDEIDIMDIMDNRGTAIVPEAVSWLLAMISKFGCSAYLSAAKS
jgi:hypothetical protein